MADWSLPTLSDLKVDVMSMLKGREVDAYTLAENPTNPPVGAKRYNHSLNKFESWNGTAWVTLVIGIAGGGTGASDINGFLDNFNLGSMALQNSNDVTITGGDIQGLGGGATPNPIGLEVVSNSYLRGLVYTGSTPVQITNSAGQIIMGAIAGSGDIAFKSVSNTFNKRQIITNTDHPYYQFEIQSGGHPTLLLHNTGAPVDKRKARVAFLNSAVPEIWFDFVNDAENLDIGGRMIFTQSGNLSVPGFMTSGAHMWSKNGTYCHNDGQGAISANGSVLMFATNYAWNNKNNTAVQMTLDGSSNLGVTGAVTAQGSVNGVTLSSNNVSEGLYLNNNGYVRAHFSDNSQPAGARKFAILNYNQALNIAPTDDTGTSPPNSDWGHSLAINRIGTVYIGEGGLAVKKVIQGQKGLDFGLYTPSGAAKGGISNITFFNNTAIFHRVGKVVTVSGRVDVTCGPVGALAWANMRVPFDYVLADCGSGVISSFDNCGTIQTFAQAGQSFVEMQWKVKVAGSAVYFYSYSYHIE